MDEDSWDDNNDEESTIPCPYCKRSIHEDSQRCLHCGNYISEEDVAPARKPWWIIVGVLLALYVVYRWIVG
jgi:predicted nucleic acid-binding Zn ribbon protein